MSIRQCVFAACLLIASSSLALAQSSIELRVVAQQEVAVTTVDGGKEYRLVPAVNVLPGEEVLYTIFFKNVSDRPATNIVIDDPIPAQMYLRAGSVFGAGTTVTFSIDGGETFDTPDGLFMVEEGGARQAKPEEYTHIRWVFRETLNPGDEGIVGFRAILR